MSDDDKIWKLECALRAEVEDLINRAVASLPRDDAIVFLYGMAEDATVAMMAREDQFRCVDCRKDTNKSGEYYTVKDEVWATSGLAPHGGMLCLRCLEKRIGRELNVEELWRSARP